MDVIDMVQIVLDVTLLVWVIVLTKRPMLPELTRKTVMAPDPRSRVPCVVVKGEDDVSLWHVRLTPKGEVPKRVRFREYGFFNLRDTRTPEGYWVYEKDPD